MRKYDAIDEIEAGTSGAGLRIGIVVARFNAGVSDGLLASCTAALAAPAPTGDREMSTPRMPSRLWNSAFRSSHPASLDKSALSTSSRSLKSSTGRAVPSSSAVIADS